MGDRAAIESLRRSIADIEAGSHRVASRAERGSGGGNGDAFSKIIALVNVSDRPEKTLRARLSQADFTDEEVDDAVERAKRCGIIDDKRYADVLIRSRLNQGRGADGIIRELRDNGIDVIDVEGWPDGYGIDDESERQRACEFLEQHPSRSKHRREGAYRKLVQKGYSSAVAATVARTWAES